MNLSVNFDCSFSLVLGRSLLRGTAAKVFTTDLNREKLQAVHEVPVVVDMLDALPGDLSRVNVMGVRFSFLEINQNPNGLQSLKT